jgi:hypothetical protein
MSAYDSLSQREFATHKERANRIAKSIKVGGEWINPDAGVIQAKHQATRDWHDSIRPMKETIRNSGANFASVMNHVQTNSEQLTGSRMGKDASRRWARDTHDKSPENFLKNIGFTQ